MLMLRRTFYLAGTALSLLVCISVLRNVQGHAMANETTKPSGSPVVVELFTSEGCSSCPPADKLLESLEQQGTVEGAPIIVLGEHVDYWDGLGWKDRFSSSRFTDRQRDYVSALGADSPYTPQMVVDGRYEFVGNDRNAVQTFLRRAASAKKSGAVVLTWTSPTLDVDIKDVAKENASVLLAVTESGLSTTVDRGENGGRVLKHTGVVRALQSLGTIKDGRFKSSTPVTVNPSWDRAALKAIVLVQDGNSGPILAAASTPIR